MKAWFILCIAGISLLLVQCTSKLARDLERVEQLQLEAQKLAKQQALLLWFHGTQGTRMHLEETYRNHQELFSIPTLQLIVDVIQETRNPNKTLELRYFKNYLLQKFVEMHTVTLDDSLRDLYDYSTIQIGKQAIYFRNLPYLLSRERSAQKRRQLWNRGLQVVERMVPLFIQKYHKSRILARQLGFPDYTAFVAEIHYFSPELLLSLAEQTLQETDSIFQALQTRVSRRLLGKAAATIHPADYPLLLSGREFSEYFPPEYLQTSYNQLLRSLGIDIKKQTGLKMDLDDDPAKIYPALCIPVDIPTDVRLSVKPSGNFQDFIQLFHILGMAQQYLHTEVNTWAFQHLGPTPVRKAFGQLFETVWENPNWMKQTGLLNHPDRKHYWEYIAFRKLFFIRHWAQIYIDGHQIFQSATPDSQRLENFVNSILIFPDYAFEMDWYLIDMNPFMNAAIQFQAALFTEALLQHLEKNFGTNWFENPRSGKFLKSLWWKGNSLPLAAILKKLDVPELNPHHVERRIEQLLTY
ncbi:MAG: hypothetical protein GXO78_13880 [Calditrichaeota bacterium]|nr:hypothetical protein [Calditrichota bacterium]